MSVSTHLETTIYSTICRNSLDGAELISLLGGGSGPSLVYRPGGVPGGNVYDNFTLLMAAAPDGVWTLQIDDSIVTPAVIPAGTYDFSNVICVGLLSLTGLTFAVGCVVTEWFRTCGFLFIDSLVNPGPLCSYVGGGTRNHDFIGTTLASGFLLIQTGAGSNAYLNFSQGSYIAGGPQIKANGGIFAINLVNSGIAPNSIADDGVTVSYLNYDAGSTSAITSAQPGATTPPTVSAVDIARGVSYSNATSGLAATQVQAALDELAGAVSPTEFVPTYTVDDSVVDTTLTAAAKVFSTIALAIAAAETAAETAVILYLLPPTLASRHVWSGPASGYAAASNLSISFQSSDRLNTQIDISGAFPAADASFPFVSFCEVGVFISAAVTGLFTSRVFYCYGMAWNGANRAVDFTGSIGTCYDADFFRPIFTGGDWGLTNVTLTQGLVAPAFSAVTSFTWLIGTASIEQTSAFGIVTAAGGGITVYVSNVVLDVDDLTNVGAYSVFNTGAAGTFTPRGVQFNLQGVTSAVTLTNAAATITAPGGVIKFPAKVTFAVPPALATPVTVPLDARTRTVFGTIEATSGLAAGAGIAIQLETAIGSGVYQEVQRMQLGGGVVVTSRIPYSFVAPAGFRYQFVDTDAGGSAIDKYSYVE